MKTYSVLLVIFILILSPGCKDSSSGADKSASVLTELTAVINTNDFSFTESLAAWHDLKAEFGNSYIYQTQYTNWESNYTSITEIGVEQGVVVSRKFEGRAFVYEPEPHEVIDATYIEGPEELNTHHTGFKPIPVDSLYSRCEGYLRLAGEDDPDNYFLNFQTTEDGLLTKCSYWPKSLQDATPYSVNVSAFDWKQ